MRSRPYKEDLLKALQDPQEAAAYLEAALADDNEAIFLMALRDVVEATVGMATLAEKTDRNRESLYKTLSATGNPHWSSIRSILDGLGYKFAIAVSEPERQQI